eukprot:TRINITY_DN5224_c0_g1_i6.p1 TRINITY_DN5224_c0_g1~~TRINITY_DN5224_c0_g1_i6.p1  ORF type:complete len:472 (-),score=46.48 TRINITY_DN5224_c0_g1_i6:345-1706(-)
MLKLSFFVCVVFWITVTDGERKLEQADRNCPYDYVDPSCKEDLDSGLQLSAPSKVADSRNYKFLVSLQQVEVEGNAFDEACYNHFCSGTIIAPNLVLSAARCFTSLIDSVKKWPYKPIYVAFYPQCRHQRNPNYKRIAVDSVYVHPDYLQGNRNADLAILTLLGKHEGQTIQIDFDEVDVDNSLQIVGYGKSRPEELGTYQQYPLDEARIISIGEQKCNDLLKKFKVREGFLNYSGMICGQNPAEVACGEDFGGPLLKADEEGTKQVGIAMWGLGSLCYNVTDTAPTLFTRLSAFKEWIKEMIIEHGVAIRTATPAPLPSSNLVYELTQEEALQSLRTALQNSPQSWQGASRPCLDWEGVQCRENDWIYKIVLRNQNLSGTLPPELSVVQTMEQFDVSGNKLSGSVPEEYSVWTSLISLRVYPQQNNMMCAKEGLSDSFSFTGYKDLDQLPVC